MWNYKIVDNHHTIYLHDCEIDYIEVNSRNLVFSFNEGIWLTKKNKYNSLSEIVRTGFATIEIVHFQFIDMWFFKAKESRNEAIFGEKIYFDLDELINHINKKKWAFEINEVYYNDSRVLFDGYINTDDNSHNCQMVFDFQEIYYQWNEIMESAIW